MPDQEKKDALERIAEVLEGARFKDGSLDLAVDLRSDGEGYPLPVQIFLLAQTKEALAAIAEGLQSIADAISTSKAP
jgi:hypothetical protein